MGKKAITVNESTVKNDFCINCGICRLVCPTKAIHLQLNKYNEKTPVINKNKCNNCGQCIKYCPNTKEKIESEAKKITSINEPYTYGLQSANFYLMWSKDTEQRQKCSSGGAVTTIALHLLKTRQINAMIHVEKLLSKRNELHFGARMSTSEEEIKENAGCACQPVDFSYVLSCLEEGKKYFITGTPCVIRGIKNLIKNHPKYGKIKIITCALICTHNTNLSLLDYFADMHNIQNKEPYQINIKNKDNNGSNNNDFYDKEKDLFEINTNDSGWKKLWRSNYFTMNACLHCSDFWGYESDISVKNALGDSDVKNSSDKSIVIVRNDKLDVEIRTCGLDYEELNYSTMKSHQKQTAVYKQKQAYNKNFKLIFARVNRKNGFLRHKTVSRLSKYLYKNFGFKITDKIMKPVKKLLLRFEKL